MHMAVEAQAVAGSKDAGHCCSPGTLVEAGQVVGKASEVEDTHHGTGKHEVHGPEVEGTHRVEVGKGTPEMDDTLKLQRKP